MVTRRLERIQAELRGKGIEKCSLPEKNKTWNFLVLVLSPKAGFLRQALNDCMKCCMDAFVWEGGNLYRIRSIFMWCRDVWIVLPGIGVGALGHQAEGYVVVVFV